MRRRTRDIQRLQEVTIEAMARLAAMRDNPCGKHLARVERLMVALATSLARQQPPLAAELDEARIAQLGKSALLHGIGKLVLPDRILLSPVPLQGEDLALLHSHPRPGVTPCWQPKRAWAACRISCVTPVTSSTASMSSGMAAVIRKACGASRFRCRPG